MRRVSALARFYIAATHSFFIGNPSQLVNNLDKSFMPVRPASVALRRGRPRKFMAPSRAVTLTLPENIIAALEAIDHDLSRAVVRLAQPEVGKGEHPAAELAYFGRRSVIVVNPTRTLQQRTGVILVPLADGRALMAFDEALTPARFELRIQDELDNRSLPAEDARVFEHIRDLLRDARRSKSITLRQQSIIVLEHGRIGVRKVSNDGRRKETE